MKTAVIILAVFAAASALPRPHLGRNVIGRIVGGEIANPNEFPYLVSLQYFGSHVCGGTIIRGDAVLTSAHCIVGEPNSLSIKAGKHNIREQEATEQTRYVVAIHVHPGYPGETTGFSSDLAVIRVQPPFVMTAQVAPIPIAPPDHLATGWGTIMGWGALREDGSLPDVAYKAEVPFVSDQQCRVAYGQAAVEDSMICAGLAAGGVDACTGDSGGPITANDRHYIYLAGIMSWGFGCARPGYPSVYTEVSHFNEFINTHAT